MREIKFRAWLKELDEMVEHDEIIAPFVIEPTDSVGGKLKFQRLFRYYTGKPHQSWENELLEDVILMQSAGLKDGKGKEIFEGDILVPERYLKSNRNGFKCEVVMDKGMFHFKTNGELIQEIKPLYKSLLVAENAENPYVIIGNCYEPGQKNGAKPLL